MTQPDDLTIERDTELDMDVSELWALISTTAGWSSWLVDDADPKIFTDGKGTAFHDGVERSVQIDAVNDGRAIGFSWWDRDDPASRSYVQLDIVELPGNKSHLHITERFVGTPPTSAGAVSCSISWEVKLVSLWLLALPFLVIA